MSFLGSVLGAVAGPIVNGIFGKDDGGSSSSGGGGIDYSILTDTLGAAAPYFSSALSYQGGKDANAQNVAIAAANNARSYQMFTEGNKFSANQAKIGRRWSNHMSNTAIYRQMRDMKRAGINPILAGKYGGAGIGSASTAGSIGVPALQQARVNDVMTPAINTANAVNQTRSNVRLQDAQVEKTIQEVTNLNSANTLTKQQIVQVSADINRIQAQARYATSQSEGQDYENALKEILVEYYKSNKSGLVSKDMGLTKLKYFEVIKEYFQDIIGGW